VRKKLLVILVASFVAAAAYGVDGRHHSPPPAGVPQKPNVRLATPVASENVTTISAVGFQPYDLTESFVTDNNTYFRYLETAPGDFLASLSLPAGAVIDYVGLGSCDQAGGNVQIFIYQQPADGSAYNLVDSLASSAHGATTPCAVDYDASALGFQITQNSGQSFQLDIYEPPGAPVDGSVEFSQLEVWWHLSVSPAPGSPTFNDVQPGDFGYQWIEALAASGITGGCGGGNFCPNNNLTRAQMAIFLAKALGLYWPN
jgi:hypothetical protein